MIAYSGWVGINIQNGIENKIKNNAVNISSESKNVPIDSKLIDQNYEKLISKYKTTGEEDWLKIISPYLIFIGEIVWIGILLKIFHRILFLAFYYLL